MKKYIDYILGNYLLDGGIKLDSKKEYFQCVTKMLPQELYNYASNDKYLISGSCGQTNKADVPWIGIFNKSITKSAMNGIYICYLFKSDMSGFYLSIGQGITSFQNKYGRNKYEYANKVANYFKTKINSDEFSKENIDLVVKKSSRGYGYEKCNIISKYYSKFNYSEEELINDLKEILSIYDAICNEMTNITYDEAIENIISNIDEPNLIGITEADNLINKALLEESGKSTIEITSLKEVSLPHSSIKYCPEISHRKIEKKDYVKKAKEDAKIGLIGERLVLEYEKDRMIKKGRSDLAEKIKQVSSNDDAAGYDILSYDFDENDREHIIYIEVKTTNYDDTVFFISRNEIEKMESEKINYWLYRVFKRNGEELFYKINGTDFDNKINLIEKDYIAEIK